MRDLPWDCVLSAELFRHYKPDPEVYLGAAALLGLAAARGDAGGSSQGRSRGGASLRLSHGFRAQAAGARTEESTSDIADDRHCTFNADDFVDLARQLGCVTPRQRTALRRIVKTVRLRSA